ncbi:MAG TPA: hypothetical protein VJR29_03815 [bacterium]|nr:hypothetical protein [bacterium]
MKKLSLAWLLLLTAAPSMAPANPFQTRFVCVPTDAANRTALEFKVRDRGQCIEGERYLEVLPQSDGSVLLLPPVQDALTPEQSRDAERYRRYFGGDSDTAN